MTITARIRWGSSEHKAPLSITKHPSQAHISYKLSTKHGGVVKCTSFHSSCFDSFVSLLMQSRKQPLGINPHFLEGSYKQMFSPAPGHMLLLFPNNICVRRWQDKERTKALHPGCWLSLQLFKVPLANRSTDSTRNSFVDLCRFIGGGTARFSYQLLLKQDILGFTTLYSGWEFTKNPVLQNEITLKGYPNLLCVFPVLVSNSFGHFVMSVSVFYFEGKAWLEHVASSPTDGVHL